MATVANSGSGLRPPLDGLDALRLESSARAVPMAWREAIASESGILRQTSMENQLQGHQSLQGPLWVYYEDKGLESDGPGTFAATW